MIWLTDVDVNNHADAKVIGLGQLMGNLTDCLRVEFRFIVPNVGLVPWREWADQNVKPEHAEVRASLEDAEGCDPSRWWVSDKALSGARIDQGYHAIAKDLR